MIRVPKSLLLLLLSLGVVPVATAGSGVTAAELAELRSGVDTVAADVELERAAARDEIAALRAERAELERQVRAARSRAKTLERVRTEATERAEAAETRARRWFEPTQAALKAARDHIERGLPFAKAERLAVIDRLERDLGAATPDYGHIVERLWRLVEEEEAMGGEVSLSQQRVELDGAPQIVSVIRLGMALLYVRTEDDRFGWATRTATGWQIELLDDIALVAPLRQRFDAHEDNHALGPATLVLPAEPATSDSSAAASRGAAG